MSAKSIKRLEKILKEEAKADERNLQKAQKDLHRAEKLFQNSVKDQEAEKAQQAVDKAAKGELKTAKVLHKAEASYKEATMKREQAERKLEEKTQREDVENQDIQQRFQQLDAAHDAFDQKERDRMKEGAELRARLQGTFGEGQNGHQVGQSEGQVAS